MINKNAFNEEKYQFNHIDIEILEKDNRDNVLAFCAIFDEKSSDDFLSPGLMEINQTLWDQNSDKRPEGYWVLGQFEGKSGLCKSYFVAEEWLEHTTEYKKEKKKEWKII